jgi:hypothetical protein
VVHDVRDESKVVIREIGQKIFVLCVPWPLWAISGSWISKKPATRNVTATDDFGEEVLSYVPLPVVSDFMSKSGQALVSHPQSHCLFSILIDGPNDHQLSKAMVAARSSHINRLRSHGTLIFGPGFDVEWFPSKFNRGSIEKLQDLLGAHESPVGKKYDFLPPILFPNGSTKKSEVFLNPALVKVRIPSYWASAT